MARALEALDIDDAPDLVRIVEEVRETGEPRVLRRNGAEVAILAPIEGPDGTMPRRVRTPEDLDAFMRSAGSWKDVDIDKFIEETYEQRRRSSRPPVEL